MSQEHTPIPAGQDSHAGEESPETTRHNEPTVATPEASGSAGPQAAAAEVPAAEATQPTTTGDDNRREQRQQAKELLERLTQTYPKAFHPWTDRRVQPLKRFIHKDLSPVIKEWGYTVAVMKQALGLYTRQLRYQQALAHESQRVDLNGEPAGEVSPQHQEKAKAQVELIQEKRRQAREARGEAEPPKPRRAPKSKSKPRGQGSRPQARSGGKPRPERPATAGPKPGGKVNATTDDRPEPVSRSPKSGSRQVTEDAIARLKQKWAGG